MWSLMRGCKAGLRTRPWCGGPGVGWESAEGQGAGGVGMDPCQRRRQKAGKTKAYSTLYSQAVSHPSTNQAQLYLASEIR